jgi:hypothetical protein
MQGMQPYPKTFNREVARFPMYEIHESPKLSDVILVLETER